MSISRSATRTRRGWSRITNTFGWQLLFFRLWLIRRPANRKGWLATRDVKAMTNPFGLFLRWRRRRRLSLPTWNNTCSSRSCDFFRRESRAVGLHSASIILRHIRQCNHYERTSSWWKRRVHARAPCRELQFRLRIGFQWMNRTRWLTCISWCLYVYFDVM